MRILITMRFTRKIILIWVVFALAGCTQPPSQPPENQAAVATGSSQPLSPDKRFGELFAQVQQAALFSDSKTFADAIPRSSRDEILAVYHAEKAAPDFDLQRFVQTHFIIPPPIASDFRSDTTRSAEAHISALWDLLTRGPDQHDQGTLIALPYPYVVPGGRFREIYYWDSYFTMLGLEASNRWDLIEHMVNNFSYLIDTFGFIPNGNRTYYLSRSQPPFYALMVKLLAENKGPGTLSHYLPQLQKEHDFWMSGGDSLNAATPNIARVVLLPDGAMLNRYWDAYAEPRPESYREDVELAEGMDNPAELYRHIRAAAESGWDFSSRWLRDGKTLNTIHTTDIIPVDLNALLYILEMTLAEAYQEAGNNSAAADYFQRAEDRKAAVLRYCWDEETGFFHDYDVVAGRRTPRLSLAGVYPLYAKMASPAQARRVATVIEWLFLQKGGLTTTPLITGQQWDAPNGWAPLQWITLQGLRHYQLNYLANRIQWRWVQLNLDVYRRTGKMMEKYNVHDTDLEGGGGEYPVQDGFGWTNGVLMKLLVH